MAGTATWTEVRRRLLPGLLLAVSGLAATGGAAPTENHVLRAVPAPAAVDLAAGLKGWDCSGAIVLADNVAAPQHLLRVSAMYDAAALYLAFEFKDSSPMVNHVDPVANPGQAWCGDTVQLRFNTEPTGADRPARPEQMVHIDGYWYTDGKQAAAYVVYGDMSPGGKTVKVIPQAMGHGVDQVFTPDADGQGYLQLMRVEWQLLRPPGPAYAAGQSLRLAIEAMWGIDEYRQQAALRVTDVLNPKQAEREMLWANPPALGTLELMPKGGVEPSGTAKLWPELLARYAARPAPAPPAAVAPPVVAAPAAPPPDRPCLEEKEEVQRLLNQWFAAGTAAGNHGDWYDNRDRDHSAIPLAQYPQLQRRAYTAAEKGANADYGLYLGHLPVVTYGNSSTSSQPERGGSNPRHAMLNPAGMPQLYAQYRGANLYVYPGHHDYQPGHNGQGLYGDLLPLNSPYMLISMGSSGSDLPFLQALFHSTAAFAPAVKVELLKQGLLIPTLQALLRASNTQVTTPADYFTGAAHPAVFRGDQLNELKMVQAAHALTVEQIPPVALLRVVAETPLVPGVNGPKDAPSEKLCDTPAVIGRVFRRWDRWLTLTVSAEPSFDAQGRALQFRWALLQGDPQRVQITPAADGRSAELRIAWHARRPVQPGSPIATNRVEIGVFASAGGMWSAPAFVCVCFPDNELRTYDNQNRLTDLHTGAGDAHLGYPATVLLPAEGLPPYPIRDWPALLALADGPGDTLAATFMYGMWSDDLAQEKVLSVRAQVLALLAAQQAERTAHPLQGLNARWEAARRDATAASQPLLAPLTPGGKSVKDRCEAEINAWLDMPDFYLRNRAKIDQQAASRGPAAVAAVAQARQRLVDLGIYTALPGGGWELHAVFAGEAPDLPARERLTNYERLELARFHLVLLTQVLLPGIVQSDYHFNYVDDRLAHAVPQWLVFDYSAGATAPPTVRVRQTDPARTPQPLEDP